MARNKSNIRRAIGSGQLAEFGPVLFIFFMMFLFPLLNLLGFAAGAATVWLMNRACTTRAASSSSWTVATTAIQNEAVAFESTGFAKFAKIVPVGGLGGTGVDLCVNRVDFKSNALTSYPPNTKAPGPVGQPELLQYIYEYSTTVTCDVGPFMNLSGVPFIGSVPGIGIPARVQYATTQNAEYPEGVTQ